jgi:zinc/manganese transport system substrate-binding protein
LRDADIGAEGRRRRAAGGEDEAARDGHGHRRSLESHAVSFPAASLIRSDAALATPAASLLSDRRRSRRGIRDRCVTTAAGADSGCWWRFVLHDNVSRRGDDPGRRAGQPIEGRIAMRRIAAALMLAVLATPAAPAATLGIVAAENFYGDVARQIGGGDVAVTSILERPDQDPHLFEASASTARRIADANVVIYNGAGYDPWAARLLAASPSTSRVVIEVAALVGARPGDNPHLWYRPATMPALARHLAQALATLDPLHAGAYLARLGLFDASTRTLTERIASLRARHAGTAVTATEPVFGYMAAALGLRMRNERFQLAMMNGTEPAAGDIAAMENDLRARTVAALVYNRQSGAALAARMLTLAQQSGVPVVGVTETAPPDTQWQDWMLTQLDALDRALAGAGRP